MTKVSGPSSGRRLRGRERDVNLYSQARSGWEVRLAQEAEERARDRRAVIGGAVAGFLAIVGVALILAAGAAPAR